VQSTGGLYECAQAQEQCVRMLESGPAAGVIGAQVLCRELGLRDAVAFDMGGTTAKAGVHPMKARFLNRNDRLDWRL